MAVPHGEGACCDRAFRQADGSGRRLVRRRAKAAGIMAPIGNHSFRATGITVCLAMAARSNTLRPCGAREPTDD
jgi:hypothetical protein